MLFLADENLEADIQVQLRQHFPDIDIIDVRDVGLDHTPDEDILQKIISNGPQKTTGLLFLTTSTPCGDWQTTG